MKPFLRSFPSMAIVFMPLLAAITIPPSGLHAQTRAIPRYTVQVKELTPEVRDRITLELNERGDAIVRFACVPAGILVFEPIGTVDRDGLRSKVLSVLQAKTSTRHLRELTMDIDDAESLCAEARNR